jgi:hypothetical protein
MRQMEIRKIVVISEEVLVEGGRPSARAPLRRAAAAAVVRNPYAGRPWSEDLSELVEPSASLAQLLAERAGAALAVDVEGYGKAALVGMAGEQEHAVACLTSAFGDALREAIGGAKAWIPSVTKRGAPGASLDVPTAYRHALWVRSHYDTVTVWVGDAPAPEEIVVALAFTGGGRPHARLGGLAAADVVGEDGLR